MTAIYQRVTRKARIVTPLLQTQSSLESQDLPLGLDTITVGTGTTSSGDTISLDVPYTVKLNPDGPSSGSGTLVLSEHIKSAVLVAGDVSQSSSGAFSRATCDFYVGSSSVSGLVACTGDIVGHGQTNGDVDLTGAAGCVACSYNPGEDGTLIDE
ncbi:hypothetical protein H2200_000835 [Cladophialophora chaetospira]|uniref:Uncharacterized protein n=1 Tax=Cladophialophora chaetospira TaxID=386627 RepID=A0AA38XQ94_9EURO|nr:hypothetical protein H2200_000835 [Cladophialophora chaetospira]